MYIDYLQLKYVQLKRHYDTVLDLFHALKVWFDIIVEMTRIADDM